MAWSFPVDSMKEHLPVPTTSTSKFRGKVFRHTDHGYQMSSSFLTAVSCQMLDEADCLIRPVERLSDKHNDSCKGSKKRPYQSVRTSDIDNDNLRDKNRRLTVDQINFLETSFNADLKLEPERKALIAKQLGLRPRQVAIWFQNRRARWKNKQVEHDFEMLKANYDAVVKEKESLIKDYESAVEDNKRLQAEVSGLTNLLQDTKDIDVNNIQSLMKEEQPSGNSELMSPTKSADCQSEVDDMLMPTEAEKVAMPDYSSQELNASIACAVRAEGDCAFFMSSDNVFGSLPVLVQQLIANGHCLEDAYNIYLGCEYFGGGWRW